MGEESRRTGDEEVGVLDSESLHRRSTRSHFRPVLRLDLTVRVPLNLHPFSVPVSVTRDSVSAVPVTDLGREGRSAGTVLRVRVAVGVSD